MTQELTPNTQITQENVEAKATELHAAADFVGKSTWHGGGTNRGHWRNQAKIALGIKPDTRRPALSPPAEGEVSREQWLWAAKIVRELGPSMSPGAMAATMERLAEKAPTPAPVDWNVVGPKLVEAYDALRHAWSHRQAQSLHGDKLQYLSACRHFDDCFDRADNARAALAAAQPQSNGE